MVRIKSAKSCPFCGGDFITITNREDYLHNFSEDERLLSASVLLKCRCGAGIHDLYAKFQGDGYIPSYEKAVNTILEKWNTRK